MLLDNIIEVENIKKIEIQLDRSDWSWALVANFVKNFQNFV